MHKQQVTTTLILLSLIASFVSLPALEAFGQNTERIVVPADFVKELSLPGRSDHFLRPGQIFFDNHASELYVVDQGHNRIVIFDGDGTYRFEFSIEGQCGSARDLVVTSEGTVLVLGSTRQGAALLKYDFDGLFIGKVDLGFVPEEEAPKLTSMAVDGNDRVYLLDEDVPRIIVLSSDLEYHSEFPILVDADQKFIREIVFGYLNYHDDELWLPVSNPGGVYRFETDGSFHDVFGRPGTKPGELNFPSAVSFIGDEMVLVLDKKRFAVLCLDFDGRFLGEFGGMGMNPGWFYYPSWMTVDADGRAYIGQIFMNRIQMCRIPDLIRGQLLASDQFGSISD